MTLNFNTSLLENLSKTLYDRRKLVLRTYRARTREAMEVTTRKDNSKEAVL